MKSAVTKHDVKKLIGKHIYAVRKDGTKVTGKLLRISGNRLILERSKDKKVKTKAIIPLVLFDLLAIGTTPFGFGPSPFGFGGGFTPFGFF